MSFTVKNLVSRASLNEKHKQKHQLRFGRGLISSWRSKNEADPPKVKEDEFEVFSYPESFRIKALRIRDKYFKRFGIGTKKRGRV